MNLDLRYRIIIPEAEKLALEKWGYATAYQAIEDNNRDALIFLLKHRASPQKKVNGKQPIILATERNDVESIKLLREYGASLDSRDSNRDTATAIAIKLKNFDAAETLINLGAFTNAQNKFGYSVMMWACRSGNEHLVRLLIKRGARVNNIKKLKFSALNEAVASGNPALVKTLVEEAGAWLYFRDAQGHTALSLAKLFGMREIADYLKTVAPDSDKLDADGNTPLLHALRHGEVEEAKRLILEGADVNARDPSNYTPLMLSAGNDYLEITQLLIARGADISAKNIYGRTATHYAAMYDSPSTLKYLIKHQADLASTCSQVCTTRPTTGFQGVL